MSRRRAQPVAPPPAQQAPFLEIAPGEFIALTPGTKYTVEHQLQPVDICFVFDTTGSMSDKIDGLVQCTVDLVEELANLNLDWRVTTVPFGDLTVPGDEIDREQPFVRTQVAAAAQLRAMRRNGGGGNGGESSVEAMQAGLAKPFRPEAVRVLVLLTDEPALETTQGDIAEFGRALRRAEVVCFVASPPLAYFQAWAAENGGLWYPIGQTMDTSGLLSLLKSLVKAVAATASAVHALAGGSVRRYLELSQGPKSDGP